MTVDTLFTGARVIDPESGLDAVRQVGVRDGTIVLATHRSRRSTKDSADFAEHEGLELVH